MWLMRRRRKYLGPMRLKQWVFERINHEGRRVPTVLLRVVIKGYETTNCGLMPWDEGRKRMEGYRNVDDYLGRVR